MNERHVIITAIVFLSLVCVYLLNKNFVSSPTIASSSARQGGSSMTKSSLKDDGVDDDDSKSSSLPPPSSPSSSSATSTAVRLRPSSTMKRLPVPSSSSFDDDRINSFLASTEEAVAEVEQQTVAKSECSKEFFLKRERLSFHINNSVWDYETMKCGTKSDYGDNNIDPFQITFMTTKRSVVVPLEPPSSSSSLGLEQYHSQQQQKFRKRSQEYYIDELVCTRNTVKQDNNNKKEQEEEEENKNNLLLSWLFKQSHLPPLGGQDYAYIPWRHVRDVMIKKNKQMKNSPLHQSSSWSASDALNTPVDSVDYFKSFHDDESSEGIFRLENFCVHPTEGLSGFGTSTSTSSTGANNNNNNIGEYLGQDDTRGLYHGELGFKRYLSRVKSLEKVSSMLSTSTSFPDNNNNNNKPNTLSFLPEQGRGWRSNRLAVFHYVAPLSLGNMYHSLHRYLNLLGILDRHVAKEGKFVQTKTNKNKGNNVQRRKPTKRDEFKDLIHMLQLLNDDDEEENEEKIKNNNNNFRKENEEDEDDDIPSRRRFAISHKPVIVLVVDVTMEDLQQQQLVKRNRERRSKMMKNKNKNDNDETGTETNTIDDHTLNRVPALGLFLSSLNIPWISVITDNPESKEYMKKTMIVKNKKRLSSLFTKTGKNNLDDILLESSPTSKAMMCFKNGIATQNCLHCEKNSIREGESYSYGMWTPATENRINMLNLHRALMKRCLSVLSSSSPKNILQSTTTTTTRVFFDVRSSSRQIYDLPLIIPKLVSSFSTSKGETKSQQQQQPQIVFGEPWRDTSYNKYLTEKLLPANVVIGVHGASFSQIPLLSLHHHHTTNILATINPIIAIELTSDRHFCFRKFFADDEDFRRRFQSCWFGSYTSNSTRYYSDHYQNNYEHWIIQLDVEHSIFEDKNNNENSILQISDETPIPDIFRRSIHDPYFVPPSILKMIIQEADRRRKEMMMTNNNNQKNNNDDFSKRSILFNSTRNSYLGDGKRLAKLTFDHFYRFEETVISILEMFIPPSSSSCTTNKKQGRNNCLVLDSEVIKQKFIPFINDKFRKRFSKLQQLLSADAGKNQYLETPIRISAPAIKTWKKIVQHLIGFDDHRMRSLLLMTENRNILEFKKISVEEVMSEMTDVVNDEKEEEERFCLVNKKDQKIAVEYCVKIKVSWY